MQAIPRIEHVGPIISAVTALSVCVSVAFMLGYSQPIGASLISFISNRDLFIIIAQSFFWNAAYMSFVFFLPDLKSRKAPLQTDLFDSGLPQPERRSWLEKRAHGLFDKASGSKISNYHFIITPMIASYIAYFISSKILLFPISLIFSLMLLIAISWNIIFRTYVFQKPIMFSHIAVLSGVILWYSYQLGNYRFYDDTIFNPVRIQIDNKPLVLIRKLGNNLLIFNPQSKKVLVSNSDGKEVFEFEEAICPDSELSRLIRRALRRTDC